jgi:cytochrome P450
MRNIPPGPRGQLLSGNSRSFYRDQLGFLNDCAREFGDIVRLRFWHVPVYLISNPHHIETVFTSRNFVKPMSLRLPLQRRIFGNGLLSSDGSQWLRQRRIANMHFGMSNWGNTSPRWWCARTACCPIGVRGKRGVFEV